MKKFIFLYLFFSVTFLSGQNISDSKFNNFINNLLINKNEYSGKKIIQIGDSINKNSKNNEQKIRSLIILSYGYEMSNKKKNALNIALKADSIAKHRFKPLQSETSRRVSDLYTKLGLSNQSTSYLDEAIKSINHVKEATKLVTILLINNTRTKLYYDDGKFLKSITINKKSLNLIQEFKNKFPENFDLLGLNSYNKFMIASNLNIGSAYLELKAFDSGYTYYKKAEILLNNDKNNSPSVESGVNTNLAAMEIVRKNSNKALFYINKAQNANSKMRDENLEYELNKVISDYYILTRDFKKSDSVKNLIIKFQEKNNIESLKTSDFIIDKEKETSSQQKRKSFLLIYICSFLLFILLASYLHHRNKMKKAQLQFDKIIDELEKNKIEIPYSNKNFIKKTSAKNNLSIPDETINTLVRKLIEFEDSEIYTNKNFTISDLSSYLGTNARYTNHILKIYRFTNFNEYINNLKINFILNKLYKHPEYLNYKIEYLSDICGFSSPSYFTKIFRQKKQISPSKFILELKKRNLICKG